MRLYGGHRFRSTKSDAIGLILLGIVMIVLAVRLAVNSYFSTSDYKHMKKVCTSSTSGVVTVVDSERLKKGRARYYNVYITTYEYEVKGEIWSGSSTLKEEERLSEGRSLTVYYDPSSPQRCYTMYDDPGSSVGRVLAELLAGVVIIAVGAVDFGRLSRGEKGLFG